MKHDVIKPRHLFLGFMMLLLGGLLWQPVLAQPANTTDWTTFVEPGLGFQIQYPAGWHVSLAADNTSRLDQYGEGVALRSIGFFGPGSHMIFVDVWINRSGKTLAQWLEAYPAANMAADQDAPREEVAMVNGRFAVRQVELLADDTGRSPRHYRTSVSQDDLVFSLEYVSLQPDIGLYETAVNSFQFIDPSQQRMTPSTLTDQLPPAEFGAQVASCCDITDFEFNPFPCNTAGDDTCAFPPCGNCTWWVRYRREGGNEANLVRCTNDALEWGGCANQFYPHLVNDIPGVSSVVVYPGVNHLSFVESLIDSQFFSVSDLSWFETCPVNYFNSSTGGNKSYILHPDEIAPNIAPNAPILSEPEDEAWVGSRQLELQWQDGGDPDDKPEPTRQFFTHIKNDDWSKHSSWIRQEQWEVEVPEDGAYEWRTKAYDGAYESGWAATQKVNVDTVAPVVVPGSQPPVGQWYNTERTITWSANDPSPGSGIAYYRWDWDDDTPENKVEDEIGFVRLSTAGQGMHRLYVKGWDQVDNESAVVQWGWFGYDTVGPQINVTAANAAPNTWLKNQIDLSWQLVDAGIGPKQSTWAWNRADLLHQNFSSFYANGAAGFEILPAIQGQHTLYLQATDQLDNVTAVTAFGWLGYDSLSPAPPTIDPGCAALNNQWQNQCHTPIFRWESNDLLGTSGSGVVDYSYSWRESPQFTPTDWSTTTSLNPPPVADPAGVGKAYLHVQARDSAGNTSSTATYGLLYDGTLPTVAFSVSEVDRSAGMVQLLSEVTDRGSGVVDIRVASNDQIWSAWQPYRPTFNWPLDATSPANQTFYLQVRDAAGNESAIASQTITRQVQASQIITPEIASNQPKAAGQFALQINGGAIYTNSPTLTLTIDDPNISEMRLSETPVFADDRWQAYQANATWTLAGDGTTLNPSRVYGWFRDADQTLFGPYFAEIIYDAVTPRTRLTILAQDATNVSLLFDQWDDHSGVTAMRFSTDSTLTNVAWEPFAPQVTKPHGGGVLYLQLQDAAGNISPTYGSDGFNSSLTEKRYFPWVAR